MPVITGAHNNSDIFLTLGIIDADTIDVTDPTKQFGQIPTPELFRALIDTGAQKTMISPAVIERLNLTPRGKILVSGVGPTADYHNGYFFHVTFIVPLVPPGPAIQAGAAISVPAMVHINTQVIYGGEIPSTGGTFDVLLGMDVLSTGLLTVHTNHFAFAY
jgi:hypothetical protein